VKISKEFKLDCYVDADYAGSYQAHPPMDPNGAKSRYGYILTLGGVPLTWKSKLLEVIVISTLEAEYHALSIAMREVLSVKHLVEELTEKLGLSQMVSVISSTVFEDNQGALILATQQRITNRTKYFHVKWHHFWSHVGESPPDVAVNKVSSENQRADYLTKPLPREPLQNNRHKVQGW